MEKKTFKGFNYFTVVYHQVVIHKLPRSSLKQMLSAVNIMK